MRRLRYIGITCVLMLVFAAICVQAGAPSKINYQGKLTDAAGIPVHGTKSMEFAIYNAPSGGSQLWTSGSVSVGVTNGLFSYVLQPSGIDYEAQAALYLEIKVEGTALSPREQITSTIYALNAATLQGQSLEELLAAGVPAGTVAIFGSSCPEGWERVTALDAKFARGAATAGGTGGYATHTHTYAGTVTTPGSDTFSQQYRHASAQLPGSFTYSGTTDATGSLPPYMDMVFCRKLAD